MAGIKPNNLIPATMDGSPKRLNTERPGEGEGEALSCHRAVISPLSFRRLFTGRH